MNEAAVNITGQYRANLTGTDFYDYFTEPQKAIAVYQQVFANGSITDSPLTLRHKGGKLTDVLFNGSVYKDDYGKVLGIVIVARDIAEQKWALDLKLANDKLAHQNNDKKLRAAELVVAKKELLFQNKIKKIKAAELVTANKELKYQNGEKEKRAQELIVAKKELAFRNDEKERCSNELVDANRELALQNNEKEKRAEELLVANEELAFQNDEKEKRAQELIIANKELAYQNDEKEKRAEELIIANKELRFQNNEKEKRASELLIANKELIFQNEEREKRKIENKELEDFTNSLKSASQYSLSLIEASRDPLFTICPQGKITDTNEASVRVTGILRDKIIGSDFFDYFTEPQDARKAYQEVFDKGFIADYPLIIKEYEAKLTEVLLNGSVYKDEEGEVLGVVVVARDITDQKRIEKETVEARIFAELATEIAEEAKSNAENATIIAENAVKAKQQFLSNMSHEIRTPMNAIIGFTKVVLKTDLSAKQKEYLTAIKLSGDALIVLINDILDLAKVDAGKMVFEKTPFKLKSSISSMLHLFETKTQEKNLKLVQNYDNNIPTVLVGDSIRLHQIILNLVSNAVKFTNTGNITVGVHMLHEDNEQVILEFAFTDTGIGIPKSKIKSIFENFQQASSGTSRLYGGTGLGLAIVKQLVEQQGGKIWVKSIVDIGTTFSFTLAFDKTDEAAPLENEIYELDTEIKDIKVLVVEDMPLNQLLMKTLLDDFGFERDIAENGAVAIEKLKNKKYDIILMDLQMPVMNGFETTKYIRKTMKSKIPIIALTADVTTVDLDKCKAVGMNDYLAKPIDEGVLYSKIIGILKNSEVERYINKNVGKIHDLGKKIKCINLAYLNEITKSNSILIKEMISLYLEQTPPLINIIKQSLEDKNWALLAAAVHKMIPSFSIMGIHTDFEDMAKKIQKIAVTKKQLEDIADLVRQIEEICLQACSELEHEFNII